MWARLKQITGGLWLALGAVFLLNEIAGIWLKGSDWMFFNVLAYTFLGVYLVCCIVGGIRLFVGSGRWLISVLAALLALYFIGIWAIAIWEMADGLAESIWLHVCF